ncbi:hypothetical protein DFJ73DRAFT_795112 [Zopfochytrium polystomum]|nr:hypothetical protein DFJ73DRAFT_795112 [Zopfochytrium polystomum]
MRKQVGTPTIVRFLIAVLAVESAAFLLLCSYMLSASWSSTCQCLPPVSEAADDATAVRSPLVEALVKNRIANFHAGLLPARPPPPDSADLSNSGEEDEDTTIIFNVFMGPPENLRMQLEMASQQRNATVREIWVNCFNSPHAEAYAQVVAEFQAAAANAAPGLLPHVHFTVSTYDYKFHGRFLLAWMARSRYVLIVDDDKPLERTQVRDFVLAHRERPGVHGHTGHIRAQPGKGAAKFLTAPPRFTEVDYLCGTWFLAQSSLDAFFRERPATWYSGEDVHLSYAARKFLGLRSYAHPFGARNRDGMKLKGKKHTATTKGRPHDVRHELFRGAGTRAVLAGCGADGAVEAAAAGVEEEGEAPQKQQQEEQPRLPAPFTTCADLLAHLGPTALVHRGRDNDDDAREGEALNGTAAVTPLHPPSETDRLAAAVCALTRCAFAVEGYLVPAAPRPVVGFNMRLGLGLPRAAYPRRTQEADLAAAITGVVENVRPAVVWVVGGRGGGRGEGFVETVKRAIEAAEWVPEQVRVFDEDSVAGGHEAD